MSSGLQTARLLLLPSDPRLAPSVACYFSRNWAFLRPFEPVREDVFFTAAGQRRLLKQERRDRAAGGCYRFWLYKKEKRGPVIGSVALSGLVRGSFQSALVSYRLDEALQGRGYATEAVERLMDFAFGTLGLHRLEASIMPRNKPSLRVVEKLGFVNEGLSRAYLNINGVWEDHIRFAKINEGYGLVEN